MNGIEGVEISVFAGEAWPKTLISAEDGYLGQLRSGMLTLMAKVAAGLPIYALDVDGQKNVRLRANKAAKADPPVEGKEFRVRIAVEYGEGDSYVNGELRVNDLFFTRYPANNLRLLKLEPNGEFHIWEIAVISQNSDFFLTVQETYSGSCYRSDDGLACPRVNKWPQMVQLLADIIGEAGLTGLPDLISYREDTVPPFYTYGGDRGVVLWWNLASGLGCIQAEQGQARVHWTQVPKRPRLAFLAKNERVTFEKVESPTIRVRPDGSQRPTGFKLEAKGVQLAS